MNIPKPLCKGNTIGIVAPASNLRDYTIKEVKEKLESYGYNVKIGKSCNLKYRGYLAGEDEIRALDLENMFLDKEVDAIMCLRGGYGCSRILNLINYDIVKQNPKIFLGFSDITALHIVFNQNCNLATYHGLMANRCIEWDEFSYNSMINSLNFKDELCIKNSSYINIKSLYEGVVEGEIIGGNLTLLASSLGTEYEIDTNGKILFIEEVGEYIYRIDRLLTQLSLAGKFKDCKGIIFGDFSDCRKSNKDDFEIYDLQKEIAFKYKKPTIYNLNAGHCMPMVTIPFGIKCILDANNCTIKFKK